jgi:hypothetical protein
LLSFGIATAATSTWSEVAHACFDALPDGAGDGRSIAIDLGKLSLSTSDGRGWKDVSTPSGVSNHRLLLSDLSSSCSGSTCVDLSAHVDTSSDGIGAAHVGFDFRVEGDAGVFVFDVSNKNNQSDYSCSGDVTDGSSSDSFAIRVEDGTVSIARQAFKTHLVKGVNYRFEIDVLDDLLGGTSSVTSLVNLDTGLVVETNVADLSVPFNRVRGVDFTKKAGKQGAFSIDNLSVTAPTK